MRTTIVFDTGDLALHETAVTASVGHFVSARLGWAVTAGGIVAGSIDHRDIDGGATLGASLSYLAVYESPRRPFVGVSASFGTALIRAPSDDDRTHSWSAWDLRGGAILGKTFVRHLVPYVGVRAFGGPVFWHRDGASTSGSDRYHVTLGAGLIVRLPRHLDVTLEVMPLGEQSATAGVSLHL